VKDFRPDEALKHITGHIKDTIGLIKATPLSIEDAQGDKDADTILNVFNKILLVSF
jgi:hypothetical protein